MNSFLASLLDRAEGRAPVLERRPRALFEPRTAGDARLVEPLEQDETIVSQPQRHAERVPSGGEERRADARPSVERIEHSRNTPPVRAAERHVSEPAGREHRGVVAPADVPQVRARAVPSEATQPTRQNTRLETVVERHESLVTVTKLVDERRASDRAAPVRDSRPDDASRASDGRRGGETSPAVKHTTMIVESSRMTPAPMPRRVPRVAAEAAVRLAQAQAAVGTRQETRAASTAAPVQITIGRVEVRAVAEKRERSQTKGPVPPRLSLDEYLSQRSGATR